MRLARKPSPAIVVASIALIVSLTGTSVAAVSQVLPRNSVGTPQLRDRAVTTRKIRDKAVGARKITKNAVQSAHIRNRSVRVADLAPEVLEALPPGPAGPQGPAGPPGTGAALGYSTVSSGTASTTTSAGFVDLPGATTTIQVPPGTTATLFLTFTAESVCTGPTFSAAFCSVRVLVDGTEAAPAVGNDFVFDSADNGTETAGSWESHAVLRTVAGLGAGSHTVTVQYAAPISGASLRLDDWALAVLALRQA